MQLVFTKQTCLGGRLALAPEHGHNFPEKEQKWEQVLVRCRGALEDED